MHPDFEPQRTAARQSLATLRVVFDQVAAALAQRCGDGQHLGGRKLDEQQVASFELAWAAADLLAAETGIAALHANSGELDTRLALLFAVDAGGAVLERLETLSLELGLPLASLRSMRDDPSWDLLRQSAAGAQALAAAGRGVAAARGESARCRWTSRTRWRRNRSAAFRRKWWHRWPNRSTARTSRCPSRCCSRCARWACSACPCPSSTGAARPTRTRTRC